MHLTQAIIAAILETAPRHIRRDLAGASFTFLSGSGHNAADFYSNVLHAMLAWPNRK